MERPLRWGICSAGNVSHPFAVSLHVKPDKHKAVAVAARDLDRAKEFAARYNIPKAYGSYQELADDPDVDVVYVGTLHTEHLSVGRLMLAAGKHLLCEKPAAMNVRELDELVNTARQNGRFFMEAIRTRFQPASLRLLEAVSADAIGDVKAINVICSNAVANIPRLAKKELGGGCLIDFGVYGIAFVNMIFKGRPEKVIAQGHLNESGVDDLVCLILQYPGGRHASIMVSVQTTLCIQGYVLGTKGCIEVPFAGAPTELVLPSGREVFPEPPGPRHLPAPDPVPWNKDVTLDDMTGFIHEADVVRAALSKGATEDPLMSIEDSRIIKEIMDEARRQMSVTYPADLV